MGLTVFCGVFSISGLNVENIAQSVPHNFVMDLDNVVRGNMGDEGLMKANHKPF